MSKRYTVTSTQTPHGPIYQILDKVTGQLLRAHTRARSGRREKQRGWKKMNVKEKRKRLDAYCRAQTGCSDCLMDDYGFGCRRVHNVPACMNDAEIEIVFDDFKQMIEELKGI